MDDRPEDTPDVPALPEDVTPYSTPDIPEDPSPPPETSVAATDPDNLRPAHPMTKAEEREYLWNATHKLVRRPAIMVRIGDVDEAFLLTLAGWTPEEACKYVKVKPKDLKKLYNKRIKAKPGPQRFIIEETKRDHWRLEYLIRAAMAHACSETTPEKRQPEWFQFILNFIGAKNKLRERLADPSGLPPPVSPEDMEKLKRANQLFKKGRKKHAERDTEPEARTPIIVN